MLLSENQLMVRDAARRFATEALAPNAAEWDRNRTFPTAVIHQMGELGLLGMLIPPEYDGAGLDHISLAVAMEEIAAGDGAIATSMGVQNSVVTVPIWKFGTAEQKERFLKPLARGEWFGRFCAFLPAGEAAHRAVRRGKARCRRRR